MNGCTVALAILQNSGGTIINVGSFKEYSDLLRRELKALKAPIVLSLINPSATEEDYHPDVIAKVILKCATHSVKELKVGAPTFIFPFMDRLLHIFRTKVWQKISPRFVHPFSSFSKQKRLE
ncbi:MAG: hypothetical protein H0V66_10270 [Bdellovibrionales bacterium]|nr:hypothetical protein [Bdellovibrionales bacterium]